MCIEVLLARFPELKHFQSSDPNFLEEKGQAAMQLLADLACSEKDCLRVGEIGVIKCGACGSRKATYSPDFFTRAKENRLA
eukprot:7497038-Alexandrium_andersonii.AAC.1